MLSGLQAEVKSCCQAKDVARLEKYVSSTGESPADIGTELEISFRNESRGFNMRIEKEYQSVLELLRFSIDFSKEHHALSGNIGRIPFLLIADVLERETISMAERVWSKVEELTDDLITPVLFSRGKMIVLKFCNALLRRLSKACNTEFCGRILMFLAAVYPLSERSAVNISGKANTSNQTGFEEELDFLAYKEVTELATASAGVSMDMDMDDSSGNGDYGINSEVDALLSMARTQFSSLSSTSMTGMNMRSGSSNNDLVAIESKEDAIQAIDFNLYRQFWGIQNFMAGDPGKDKNSVATPTVVAAFCADADAVLSAFEANAFTDSELEQAIHSWEHSQENAVAHTNSKLATLHNAGHSTFLKNNATAAAVSGDSNTGDIAYAGCKYLTSSQLFALQLKDPIIREQYLAQMLFHLEYVRSKVGVSTAVAPSAITAAAMEEAGKATLSAVTKMESRIYSILKKTPPNGGSFLKSLRGLLDRERHWAAWKKKGCPSYERSIDDVLPFPSTATATTTGVSHKRKRGDSSNASSSSTKSKDFSTKITASTLQSTLSTISKNIPSFDAHMETYLDAEDPDAGIEEEYHPKNDKVFCWRARRLLATKRLAAFEDMADGDVGKGLKKMQKLLPAAPATDVTATITTAVDIESESKVETSNQ